MYTLRFDMRAPKSGAPSAELYSAALEMTAYTESRGALLAMLCEHHGAADGYLPAPLILASAISARTSSLPVKVTIFNLPLYHPVRLAEEMCVLDVISGGRVSYVGGIGYLPSEYEASGIEWSRRGKIADEYLELLLEAVKGEPFEYHGRRIHITPPPLTVGGPHIAWGGGSIPAARRAGRLGLDFAAQSDEPELRPAYEKACADNGHEVGSVHLPARDQTHTVFVADDIDTAWTELGQYLMHDVNGYAEWNEGREVTSVSRSRTADQLRAENTTHRILTVDEAVDFVRAGAPLPLHPLIGGMPPELAWKYLSNVTEKVMPALSSPAPALSGQP